MAMQETGSRPPRRRRPTGEGTRNPLVALAIALPVAALLAYAFGGWHQFALQANTMVQLIGH
ncbi:hypothetical protein [Streptacidiphilus jiangxiensis]|uniref:Uncharacterized protein n=1 Tax=Streptacidiphilus jiangxiensis TaxID=235985 RepID=A0A1H7XIC8_STRJI|nr:hypothetical protein [Streptacidiphilus jiangxiensis]SEM32769.1 hypothetical protein SAMN05414137_1242 [Streptacidiphilus jiangxiensis]